MECFYLSYVVELAQIFVHLAFESWCFRHDIRFHVSHLCVRFLVQFQVVVSCMVGLGPFRCLCVVMSSIVVPTR